MLSRRCYDLVDQQFIYPVQSFFHLVSHTLVQRIRLIIGATTELSLDHIFPFAGFLLKGLVVCQGSESWMDWLGYRAYGRFLKY